MAGNSFSITLGTFVFLPKTRIFGTNPERPCKEFLALTAHATAVSAEQFVSSIVFRTDSLMTALCLSQTPFDQGLSAAVFIISIFRDSHIDLYSEFANSPPLSARNFLGLPK